jgi:hypothetical protein
MKTLILSFTAAIVAVLTAFPCRGQELIEQDDTAELRREVTELRSIVNELMKKIDAMEYGRMPRIETTQPQPPNLNRHTIVPSQPGTSKLRFPIDIERGSAAPIRRDLRLQRFRE